MQARAHRLICNTYLLLFHGNYDSQTRLSVDVIRTLPVLLQLLFITYLNRLFYNENKLGLGLTGGYFTIWYICLPVLIYA